MARILKSESGMSTIGMMVVLVAMVAVFAIVALMALSVLGSEDVREGLETVQGNEAVEELVPTVMPGNNSGDALSRCITHLDEGGGWQWNVDCQLVGKARLAELGLID